MVMAGVVANEDYMQIKHLVDRSTKTMKTSKLLMTNNFLTRNSSTKAKMNKLLRAKPLLTELTRLLKHQKLTMKTVAKTLEDVEKILNELDKFNKYKS